MSSYKLTGGHHHGRAAIADFICPDNGYRGLQQRRGVTPRDHMKENRLVLRQVQQKQREDREDAARQPKDLYKLQQFRDVKPRLYDASNRGNSARGGAAGSSSSRAANLYNDGDEDEGEGYGGNGDEGNYGGDVSNDYSNGEYSSSYQQQHLQSSASATNILRKGTDAKRREELKMMSREARKELEAKAEDAKWIADRPETPRKGATPKAYETAQLAPRSNSDFISRNRAKALTMLPPKAPEKNQAADLHEEFGKVPDYLEERKAKWAKEKEEMKRRLPDPSCPPGMTLMPEEERLSTLEVLKASKEDATKQLAKLPFVIETPSLKKRHSDLETKLREIENAIALFSKTKVYIALDR